MRILALGILASLAVAGCDATPPADNAVVPPEAVCDNVVIDANGNETCVAPDKNLPSGDKEVINETDVVH